MFAGNGTNIISGDFKELLSHINSLRAAVLETICPKLPENISPPSFDEDDLDEDISLEEGENEDMEQMSSAEDRVASSEHEASPADLATSKK